MKAAVLEKIGQPLRIDNFALSGDLILDEHEVFVRMFSAGICGAQLQEIDGLKGDPKHCPHFLGHEGCGIVIEAGLGAKKVEKGDKVVIHWRKGEGAEPSFRKLENVGMGHCTTFSEYTIVSANRVTKIPHDVPNDFAALLGCCLSTALATVENVAKIRESESVLIVGVGGLGLAMILAARLAGANPIVATDREYSKWKLVKAIGATRFFPAYTDFHWQDFSNHTTFPTSEPFPWPKHDVIINTVGSNDRDYLLKNDGRYIRMTGPGKNSEGGDFNPSRDIPRYVDMWRAGKLEGWEKIITHRIKLEQINEGIQLMRNGKAGRVMIEFEQ